MLKFENRLFRSSMRSISPITSSTRLSESPPETSTRSAFLSSPLSSPPNPDETFTQQVYFDRVRACNPHESTHPYFDRIIKPLLEREPLELDDADSIDLDEEIKEIREEREEAAAESAAARK